MVVRRLFDTNTALYLLGDRLTEPLVSGEYFVSVITEMELLSYPSLETQQELQIQDFLQKVTIVNLNSEIKRFAIELRRVRKLKLPDAIIVATAMAINAELLTNDQKLQLIPGVIVRALPLKEPLE
jgi:predicted nucleic acid-binding protein